MTKKYLLPCFAAAAPAKSIEAARSVCVVLPTKDKFDWEHGPRCAVPSALLAWFDSQPGTQVCCDGEADAAVMRDVLAGHARVEDVAACIDCAPAIEALNGTGGSVHYVNAREDAWSIRLAYVAAAQATGSPSFALTDRHLGDLQKIWKHRHAVGDYVEVITLTSPAFSKAVERVGLRLRSSVLTGLRGQPLRVYALWLNADTVTLISSTNYPEQFDLKGKVVESVKGALSVLADVREPALAVSASRHLKERDEIDVWGLLRA